MRIHRWLGISFALGAGLLLNLTGCDKQEDKGAKPNAHVAPKDNNSKAIEAKPVARAKALELPTFDKSVIIDPAPQGEMRPPDLSINGKKVAKIFEAVANDLWDKANFRDSDGRRVKYQALLATELGDIQIDLYGDIAPNHVRSFVALIRAGYYDGMKFYYTFNHEVEGVPVGYIESGCPKGTGEDGYGSVGYWLRPEFSDKVTHEPGTIGACLRETDDTAACRFYITTVALPKMDGRFTAFGKVTRGLDVVRTINTRPADEMDRPQQPVTIKSVIIRTIPE